jgi:epoxyqueuosine reductase QueG
VLERTTTRALPVLNKAVDLTPAAQACCGMCRACMSTNIASALAAVGLFAARPVIRLAKRFRH